MTAFWDAAPCSLVEVDRLSEVRTASIMALVMEAVQTSETPAHFHQCTRRYISEICHLNTSHRQKLNPHMNILVSYAAGTD
jgi:hypothetical protein